MFVHLETKMDMQGTHKQGKQGKWKKTIPCQGNTWNLKMLPKHRENTWNNILAHRENILKP